MLICQEPHTPDVSSKTQSTTGSADGASSLPPTRTGETTPTTTLPSSDYRQKYRHLIGGLECAEKTAVKMEPNRTFGYGQSYCMRLKLFFWTRERKASSVRCPYFRSCIQHCSSGPGKEQLVSVRCPYFRSCIQHCSSGMRKEKL